MNRTRAEHLQELCKYCKHRNMDFSEDILCSIHGDVPDFDLKCPDYAFSEKTQKKVEKREAKESKRAGKGRSKLFPIVLAIGGFIRAAMKGFEDPMGIVFFILGIGWLIVVISKEQQE